jgi:hypothetical protein
MDEETLRRLAETLQTELPALIADAAAREPVEQNLTQALDQPAGTATDALHAALSSHPATRDWMRRTTGITKDVDAAVGTLGAVLAAGPLFVCPEGDYSVVRESVSSDVLFCPNDGSILERVS